MKSYLSGNPALRLALNEDLIIGKGNNPTNNYGAYGCVRMATQVGLIVMLDLGYNALEIDDCNFHECVRLDEWENYRIMSFVPPEGEFVVMNYRITSDFRVPFRIFPFFELTTPRKVDLVIKVTHPDTHHPRVQFIYPAIACQQIRADIPEQNYGGNVLITFPVPASTAT